MVVAEAVIETVGIGLTVIAIGTDWTIQPPAVETTTCTTSPSFKVLLVHLGAVAPGTAVPLRNH
jgi:hypothetical protein